MSKQQPRTQLTVEVQEGDYLSIDHSGRMQVRKIEDDEVTVMCDAPLPDFPLETETETTENGVHAKIPRDDFAEMLQDASSFQSFWRDEVETDGS